MIEFIIGVIAGIIVGSAVSIFAYALIAIDRDREEYGGDGHDNRTSHKEGED